MKGTKIMLGSMLTFFLTWLTMATIAWAFDTDDSLKFNYYMSHGGIIMLMLTFGWIPAVIVGKDIDDRLSPNSETKP